MKTSKKFLILALAMFALLAPAIASAQLTITSNITGVMDGAFPDGTTFNNAVTFAGGQTMSSDTVLANGKALKGDAVSGDTWKLSAFDNNTPAGGAYVPYLTFTNGNTPSLAIAPSAGGSTLTIDGATIGGTTAGAGTFSALAARNTTNQLTLGATAHTLILSSTAPAGASQTLTLPDPTGADSVAYLALAQALTNKTYNGNTWTAGTGILTLQGSAQTYTSPPATDTLAGLATAQSWTGVNTYGAASSIVSKTSTSSTDINPPYDNRILGNPVVKYVYGSCSVAAVNAGTCVPLALGTGRTIAVLNYDIVAAGSAATCTGILLEDTTGTPVVVSTIAAAALTSGAHNFPGLANNVLGVGFGAGSGLTVSQGLQIKVNGSSCTTTTAFQYAITYAVQ